MVLFYILGTVVFINCAYFFLFSKFSLLKKTELVCTNSQPVSLIVCAKNEAKNLEKHIPLWLNQAYNNFELILINDASIDESLEVMERFSAKDPRIQIVNVRNNEAFWGNKKYALTLGIKKAKYNLLVFTDADCYPASPKWLTIMASKFSSEKKIVLGYGAYEKRKGFLNKLIRFETLMTAIQYLSYAKADMPYMGVGRNLAYTNKVYTSNNGFMSHIKVVSGDDDLLVNEAATTKNTAICVNDEGFTYSLPKETFRNWIKQKARHYTTAKRYKAKHRFLLGFFYISNLAFWILSTIVLFTPLWKEGLVLIAFRLILQYIIIGKGAKKLKEADLIFFIPFFELFLVLTQLSIFISNSGSKQQQWK